MTLDNGTIQLAVVFGACVAATLIVCLTVWLHHAESTRVDVARAAVDRQKYLAQISDNEVKNTEAKYKLALLERVGSHELDTVDLHIPQADIDALALDKIKARINAMRIEVKVNTQL